MNFLHEFHCKIKTILTFYYLVLGGYNLGVGCLLVRLSVNRNGTSLIVIKLGNRVYHGPRKNPIIFCFCVDGMRRQI